MNILFLMSGSIACAKASGLISIWAKQGHSIKVACTASVSNFIGKATLEGLSGSPVYFTVFEEQNMMEHIHLSRWADKIVLAPATANIINKIAHGIADDLVTSIWVAAYSLGKPMFLVPAMNSMMWDYPATQASVSQLKHWGVHIISPASGELACGETGPGRMPEIEDIDRHIFASNAKDARSILITAGGMREYIDGVRYIGNYSSGRTGAEIANYFSTQGFDVTWLGAKSALQPARVKNRVLYETFEDLSSQLSSQLKQNHFDIVIHAAAVSDFSVESLSCGKLKQSASRENKIPSSETLQIQLKRNPKLVNEIKNWSVNPDIRVVAFKLTNTNVYEDRLKAVDKLMSQSAVDYVVHNDMSDISQTSHSYNLFDSRNKNIQCKDIHTLCHTIYTMLEKKA